MQPHKHQNEKNQHFPPSTGCTLANAVPGHGFLSLPYGSIYARLILGQSATADQGCFGLCSTSGALQLTLLTCPGHFLTSSIGTAAQKSFNIISFAKSRTTFQSRNKSYPAFGIPNQEQFMTHLSVLIFKSLLQSSFFVSHCS